MKKIFLTFALLLYALQAFSRPQMAPLSFKDTAAKIRPSVVNIRTVKNVSGGFSFPGGGSPLFDDFFERFFGERPGPGQGEVPGNRSFQQRSLGSGVIIDARGYVLTNDHVVGEADKIKVKLSSGDEFDAEVVGRDSKTDLAVIKLKNATGLTAAAFGSSENASVGDWVLAVGSPFGLEQTVSHGIISAKGRVIGAGPYDDFLQTDAPINPGNSGGPLVDLDGAIIGINTAITSRSGGNEGVGFAIPSDMAQRIYNVLVRDGHVTRGWLGVSIQELSDSLREYFNVPKGTHGVVIADVLEEGPAREAGFESGDVLVEFNGKPVEHVRGLQVLVAESGVGNKVQVKVWRSQKYKTLHVMVGNMADFDAKAENGGEEVLHGELGLDVRAPTPEEAGKLKLKRRTGVIVSRVSPGGAAEEAGLKPGDLVIEMDKRDIDGPSSFRRILAELKKGESHIMRVRRGERSLYLSLAIPD